MRAAIVTGSRRGTAARCLPALVEQPGVDVVAVVHCQRQFVNRRRRLRRDLRKVAKIGPLGALAGYHMRGWFKVPATDDLEDLARRYGIEFVTSPRTNADETAEALRRCEADVGLSLGNGMLYPKVFDVPRLGMLNVHGEVLPDFQGASSVVWPIYEGRTETGFTIHVVDRQIDTGPILYQERYPIEFRDDLAETVRHNCAETARRIPPALARVVADYEHHLAEATVQTGGGRYTTPTWRQYRRMQQQFESLRAQGADG